MVNAVSFNTWQEGRSSAQAGVLAGLALRGGACGWGSATHAVDARGAASAWEGGQVHGGGRCAGHPHYLPVALQKSRRLHGAWPSQASAHPRQPLHMLASGQHRGSPPPPPGNPLPPRATPAPAPGAADDERAERQRDRPVPRGRAHLQARGLHLPQLGAQDDGECGHERRDGRQHPRGHARTGGGGAGGGHAGGRWCVDWWCVGWGGGAGGPRRPYAWLGACGGRRAPSAAREAWPAARQAWRATPPARLPEGSPTRAPPPPDSAPPGRSSAWCRG